MKVELRRRHKYFNTNNLWVNLDKLQETLEQQVGLPSRSLFPSLHSLPQVWGPYIQKLIVLAAILAALVSGPATASCSAKGDIR